MLGSLMSKQLVTTIETVLSVAVTAFFVTFEAALAWEVLLKVALKICVAFESLGATSLITSIPRWKSW